MIIIVPWIKAPLVSNELSCYAVTMVMAAGFTVDSVISRSLLQLGYSRMRRVIDCLLVNTKQAYRHRKTK